MFRIANNLLKYPSLVKKTHKFALSYSPLSAFSNQVENLALCSDPIDPICRATFEKFGWKVTELEKSPTEEELIKIIGDYNALVVRSGTTVTPNVFDHATNLKFVGRAGSGVDNIDLKAATNKGVVVMNTPGGNTVSTAEHTMALMMSLSRNIPQGHLSLKDKTWKRKQYSGVELYGKTIGIIGLGKIGQLISQWCQAFGMRVVGFDPVLSDQQFKSLGIENSSLDRLYEHSDYITVHTPLNNKTRNLLNDETLAKCKDGVRLINCARGGIINEEALLKALKSKKVAGAALDVFTVEPPTENAMLQELINHPRVITTPHLGASTEEAQIKVAKNIAQQIVDATKGEHLFGVVNAPIGFEHSLNPVYKPYINVGERLGAIQAQMCLQNQSIKSIHITYHGDFLKKSSNIITAGVIKGFLNDFEDDHNLNLMNSQAKASEIGLHIQESFDSEHQTTKNSISVDYIGEVEGKEVKRTVVGSCFGANKQPHLIQVDDFEVFLPLEGNIILQFNKDFPGILSDMTKILSDNDVNIENLYLGRLGQGKAALTALQVGEPISQKLQKQIQQIKNVDSVFQVSLTDSNKFKFSSQPALRPNNPNFSSGPCSKHPEYSLKTLSEKDSIKILGRSHRSKLGKSRITHAFQKTRDLLGLPADYRVGLVPASDTGAVEMAMWSMLGQRPVDVAYWESFGKGWYQDIKNHLKIDCNDIGTNEYGTLPDLSRVNPENDLVFAYNGTTSGVKVPNLDFISENRRGITIADCTSAVFAQDITPYSKLDVITYSWQKVLGGEGAHGIMILSPRAIERLESYTPDRPLPKIFRMVKKGVFDESIFKDSPINTPSMLCLEDYIDSLEWVERIGGLEGAQNKCNANLQVVEDFVAQNNSWLSFLCADPAIRSNTSVCLKVDATSAEIKQMTSYLENEEVVFDIGGYKDAPPSLRIWCGATVQQQDVEIALQWIKHAYEKVKSQ